MKEWLGVGPNIGRFARPELFETLPPAAALGSEKRSKVVWVDIVVRPDVLYSFKYADCDELSYPRRALYMKLLNCGCRSREARNVLSFVQGEQMPRKLSRRDVLEIASVFFNMLAPSV